MLWFRPPHDVAVGARVLSRSDATGWLAPLGLGVHTNRRATLATTMRMVARIHNRSAHLGPATHPALPSSLTDSDVLVIEVADLADCRQAINKHLAHLTGWHTQRRIVALLRHQLRRSASATYHH